MGSDTQALRDDIESTRAEMGDTLDAIGDRVSPSHMARRSRNRVAQRVQSMRDRLMGSVDEAEETLADAAGSAADAMHRAPEMVSERTQGAPMVAGAIAFGIGFLVAALFPASEKEREVAGQAMQAAEPIREELVESARDMSEHLKEPAHEAADAVKASATESAQTLRDEARQAAAETKQQATDAVESVQESAGGSRGGGPSMG
jgi:gas vesicle protein